VTDPERLARAFAQITGMTTPLVEGKSASYVARRAAKEFERTHTALEVRCLRCKGSRHSDVLARVYRTSEGLVLYAGGDGRILRQLDGMNFARSSGLIHLLADEVPESLDGGPPWAVVCERHGTRPLPSLPELRKAASDGVSLRC
jgi:hypothetical protein